MGNINNQEVSESTRNGAVDKIRDLLFGSQMDSYELHFRQLETMIFTETKRSMEDMSTRLIAMESSINQRIEETEQNQKRERQERIETFNGVNETLDAVNETLQQNFQRLDDQLQQFEDASSKDITDIKTLLDQQNQSLETQVQALRDELNRSLNEEARRLDKQTVNRQQLALLLSELSTQVNNG